jgi:hypothetical protein
MKKYREEFPDENIYIHNPTEVNPKTLKHPQKYVYKYIFIWRALTPTGKLSKYFHAEKTNKWREDSKYQLPKLREGYQWKGPYLYGKYETY